VLGVRHGAWKLISREDEGGRRLELYNIQEDPYEERDVVKDCPDRVKDLAGMIEEERQQDGSSARQDVNSPMVS
jgi:arylsulfatase A-like enzyme